MVSIFSVKKYNKKKSLLIFEMVYLHYYAIIIHLDGLRMTILSFIAIISCYSDRPRSTPCYLLTCSDNNTTLF